MTNSFASEFSEIKNLKILIEPKKYESLVFSDAKNEQYDLEDFRGNLVLMNFWATWCAPCKEEMPSLNLLQIDENFDEIKILPINIGQETIEKAENFFQDLEINNLNLYFGSPVSLANKVGLRGIPTTIIFNKKGEEFARVMGSLDFENKDFINWLSSYN